MTKHNSNCTRVFKNYDMDCPRCRELANGAKPREGWQTSYFKIKGANDRATQSYIKANTGAVDWS